MHLINTVLINKDIPINKTWTLYFSHHLFYAQNSCLPTLQALPMWKHDCTGKSPPVATHVSTCGVNPL